MFKPWKNKLRYEFIKRTLARLIKLNLLCTQDSILAVCSGVAEKKLFENMNFKTVTISSLDGRITDKDFAPFNWKLENVQALSYDNDSFDFVFVSDGLHHCNSPHMALIEMYRVCRKGIIVFESRDSLLMRFANSIGLIPNYEIEAVIHNQYQHGGVNNTSVPNYIYRWTEREFEKTIISNCPEAKHAFRYFYGLNLPYKQANKNKMKYYFLHLIAPLASIFTKIFKKQGNSFGMVAFKPKIPQDLYPWLELKNNKIVFCRDYAKEKLKHRRKTLEP